MLRRLRVSLDVLCHTVPVDRILFLTLTFSPNTTDKEANDEFTAVARDFTKLFSGGWVRVLAFNRNGAPHIHAILVADRDVRTGFNNEAYEEMRELDGLAVLSGYGSLEELEARRYALGRSLTTNKELKRLWQVVRQIIKRRRKNKRGRKTFAPRFELCPVRKNEAAVSKYLIGNARESASRPMFVPSSKRPVSAGDKPIEQGAGEATWFPGKRTKGVRLVAYSRSFPRVAFLPLTKGEVRFHEKLNVITRGLKMPREYLPDRFSGKWSYYIRNYVMPLVEAKFGPDVRTWNVSAVGKIAEVELCTRDRWTWWGWPAVAWVYAGCPRGVEVLGDFPALLPARADQVPNIYPVPPVPKKARRAMTVGRSEAEAPVVESCPTKC